MLVGGTAVGGGGGVFVGATGGIVAVGGTRVGSGGFGFDGGDVGGTVVAVCDGIAVDVGVLVGTNVGVSTALGNKILPPIDNTGTSSKQLAAKICSTVAPTFCANLERTSPS